MSTELWSVEKKELLPCEAENAKGNAEQERGKCGDSDFREDCLKNAVEHYTKGIAICPLSEQHTTLRFCLINRATAHCKLFKLRFSNEPSNDLLVVFFVILLLCLGFLALIPGYSNSVGIGQLRTTCCLSPTHFGTDSPIFGCSC